MQRRKKDGTLENVACPPIISTYNCYMGGVDKNDQMKSYYGINISGKKWWTRVFFDLIDRAIFNGKVLFNESPHTSRKSLKDFKVDLAKLLIGNFRNVWRGVETCGNRLFLRNPPHSPSVLFNSTNLPFPDLFS